jgi:hypothetical protein
MLCQCTLILKNVALIKYVLQSYRASHWTTSLLPVPIINLLPVPIINLLPVPVNRHYVILCSTAGGDVMLDINASTGGVTNRGNNLDDDDTVMRYTFFSDYIVSLGVSLRPGCTTSIGCTSAAIAPVPNALMVLNGMQDLQALAQDDFKLAGDDGLFDSQSRIQAVSGRFFVPDLAPGDYLIEIAVMIGAIAAMDIADDEDWYSDTTVVLGPHIIVAQVLQATNRVCDPSMYMEVM